MKRRTNNRKKKKIRKRVIIICEGYDEKIYFNSLRNDAYYKSLLSGMSVKPDKPKNQSLAHILRYADYYIENEGYLKHPQKKYHSAQKFIDPVDDIWLVFDHDNRDTVHGENFAEFFKKCRNRGLNIAFSNPSFEFWILLHFMYCEKHFSSKKEIKTYCNKNGIEINNWNAKDLFPKTKMSLDNARKNAIKIREKAENNNFNEPYKINPFTNIDQLIDVFINSSE